MNKSALLKFIELYNLSGTVEKVKIVSDGTNLTTAFVTEDKTLYGTVTYNDLKVDAGDYGIHDTKQLLKMLNILDEEIVVAVVRLADKRAIGFSLADKNTESLTMLADLSVIPKAPLGVNVGKVDLEITIDEDFIERYVRAKNAISEATTMTKFTFVPKPKGGVEMIIGYSNINTNRIRLEVAAPTKDTPATTVSFNADAFKEILVKNRGAGNATLKVNSSGLGHVQFKTKEYEANYYLLKVTI